MDLEHPLGGCYEQETNKILMVVLLHISNEFCANADTYKWNNILFGCAQSGSYATFVSLPKHIARVSLRTL